MIDTEKLLGRINDKGVILSEKSISNLGVVRRRLVDIDGMLKEKLVLAKVREGIRRQEEERLKRVEREDEIEEKDDDDRDIDTDSSKVKRKKPKPSGPGGILGPAGALLTGAGIAVVAQNLGFFRFATQVLKGVGSVALSTFMGLATVVDTGYKIVSAVEAKTLQMFGEKGLKTLKTFQKVFTTFVNVAVISALSAAGMRAFGFTRGKLFPKVPKVKAPKVKTPTPVDITDLRTKPTKKIKNVINFQKELKKRRGRPKKFETVAEVQADLNLREFQKLQKKFLKLKKSKKVVKPKPTSIVKSFRPDRQPDLGLDDSDMGRFRPPEVIQNDIRSIRIRARQNLTEYQMGFISADDFEIRRQRLVEDLRLKRNELNFVKSTDPLDRMAQNLGIDPELLKSKVPKKQKRLPSSGTVQQQQTQQPQAGGRRIKSENFFEDPSGGPGAMKLRRGIISNADDVTNIKSLSKLLEAFGGLPLVKATRRFLGNTVGRIPLIGDLIGLALDYFVFKEPIQRALFMAAGGALGGSIGAWLGGILGTAVPVVGNLAGAVVGGFLGGVGGDMLGGFLYDVLFAGKPGFPAGESQTPLEKGAKGAVKLGLSGGGLVPALLSMNNGGSVPDIAYSASYDKPGAGSVRFIPIFVPSEDRDVESANVSGVVITKRKRSQSSLYAGGLIS